MHVNEEIKALKAALAQEKEKTSALAAELSFYKTSLFEPDILLVLTTPSGHINSYNSAFGRFVGSPKTNTIIAQEITSFTVWQEPILLKEAIKKALLEEVSTTKLFISRKPDIHVNVMISTLKEGEGKATQLLILMTVIESQALEKQYIQIKENKFKSILNFAPFGVSWFLTDAQSPSFINDLLWESLGYNAEERTSINLISLFPVGFFQHLLGQLSAIPAGKKHFMSGVEFKHKNSSPVFFNIISDILQLNGKQYIFSFYRDVSEEKKTQDLLIRKEESLRQAQRVAKIGNWEWNLRDDSRYYSDELFHIHGFTPSEDFSYQAFIELVHPEDRERVSVFIQEALYHYQAYDMEFRLLMPNGQIKYIHGVSKLFVDQEGKPEKMIGTLQDISERVLAQEALKKSEKRLTRAQHIGKVGYWEWNMLNNEVYWSDELYGMYEQPKGTFIPTIDKVIEMMLESDRKRVTEHIYNSIDNKQTYYEVEGYVRTGSGKLKYIAAKAEIMYDTSGNPIRMEGVSQDITSIKKAEEALSYSNYLLQQVNDAIFSTDEKMQVTSWNKGAERIYGWTSEEAVGKNLLELLQFEPPAIDSQMHREFTEKGCWKGEHILRKKDGSAITIQAQTILLKDENLQIVGMVSVDRDVTEFNALQAKVSESEKMLQLIINSVPQAIFWKDIHSVYLGCNENFAKMALLSNPVAISGKTDFDMPWGTEKANLYIQFDREILMDGKPRLNRIATHTTEEGKLRWLNVNMLPLQDYRGNNIGILGTLDDITEKKIIEEKLNHKQANLEAIIENTDSLIWSVSREYTILAMNSKLAEFYKQYYQIELQVGDNYLEVLPEWLHTRWIANHKKVLNGEKIIITRRFTFGKRHLWFDIFCFPIIGFDGQISGVAYMSRDVTERIKNERLILKYIKQHNTLKLKQEKLKMLAMLQGQEEERRKISMELHDGVGQLQTALLYKTNKLTDKLYPFANSEINTLASEITGLQKDIYQEIRRISEHLMPQYISDFPLDKAIAHLLSLSFKNTNIVIEPSIELDAAELSKNLEVAVFRIIQEIINNVLKHAQANYFYIRLYNSKQHLHLLVKDNGVGFDLSAVQSKIGKGLLHIKERISLLNGTFTIVSQPGRGCAITIKIPIF